MSDEVRLRWAEVEPIGVVNGELNHVLSSVDTLRQAWDLSLAQASRAEFTEARRRSLRRHAIETGIIERLYHVDWCVTEALVAEGLTAEVAAREGGLDDDALAIISSQYDALEFLAEAARNGTDLSLHFVRQLNWSDQQRRRQRVPGLSQSPARMLTGCARFNRQNLPSAPPKPRFLPGSCTKR